MNIITFTSCPVDGQPGQRTHTEPLTAAETEEFRAISYRVGYSDLAVEEHVERLYHSDVEIAKNHARWTAEVKRMDVTKARYANRGYNVLTGDPRLDWAIGNGLAPHKATAKEAERIARAYGADVYLTTSDGYQFARYNYTRYK